LGLRNTSIKNRWWVGLARSQHGHICEWVDPTSPKDTLKERCPNGNTECSWVVKLLETLIYLVLFSQG
jgi:hypothetical protein